jgi:hypothetical protein
VEYRGGTMVSLLQLEEMVLEVKNAYAEVVSVENLVQINTMKENLDAHDGREEGDIIMSNARSCGWKIVLAKKVTQIRWLTEQMMRMMYAVCSHRV